ncbi:MAG: glutathione S-transferase [Pseudomonadota bacterium]
MTYNLAIGDFAYSSWSLRGWLLFDAFGLKARLTRIDFAGKGVAEQLGAFAPARTVPALRFEDGTVIGDSLAMAEELASREPDAGLWPIDPRARAVARALAGEMHASFSALRSTCPMNLRLAYTGFEPPEDVAMDVRRIEALWCWARQHVGAEGPWLAGSYSVADAFFAPVAGRIAGFSIPVSDEAAAYVAAHLGHMPFRRWRAMALASGAELPWYAQPYGHTDWPGPTPSPAKVVETGTPENTQCPYSGKPVTHLMESSGRVFGFCNAFCRDKTMADPEAWPAFTDLLGTAPR